MDRQQARAQLEALLASDAWMVLMMPRVRQAMDDAVAQLLHREDNEPTNLAFTKGLIRGIMLVSNDLPELLRQELDTEL